MKAVLLLIGFFSLATHAIEIPRKLDAADRTEVVRILGLSTSHKLLTNPYPLGGYSGFEIGISVEQIDLRELAKQGCAAGSGGCPNRGEGRQSLSYSRLTLGKGLYNNLDLFLNFSLLDMDSDITSYGGGIRYSFYEAKFLPISVGIVGSATHINVNNDFSCFTLGADLVAGIYVDQFSLYLGVGQLSSTGTFIAGTNADGTIDPGGGDYDTVTNTTEARVKQTHSLAGITVHFANLFGALQVDRFPETAYSGRLGLRF